MRGLTNIRLLHLDVNACKRDIEKALTANLKEAVRAYLRAIIFNVVPVWSGASVATFMKLAAAVNQPLVIVPKVSSRVGLGASRSTGALNVDMSKGEIKATYSTSLPHLIYNEFNNANAVGYRLINPGPYRFQDKGAEAFKRIASQARLPNPYKHLKQL